MRTLQSSSKVACSALALVLSGCWMGGNTRSNDRPLSPTPAPPVVNSPQYGPTAPLPEIEPAPTLEGPVLEGPAFPQSKAGDPAAGFDRKRHTRQMRDEDARPGFAGTSPPPIIPDGPVADNNPDRTVGYIELPSAPKRGEEASPAGPR